MVTSRCETCGNPFHWSWEEAFDKFGFGDGDGQVETWQVCAALKRAGYKIRCHRWGAHNLIIHSVRKDGAEHIPEGAPVGYADPRTYLPAEIVALLDKEFPSTIPYYNAGAES